MNPPADGLFLMRSLLLLILCVIPCVSQAQTDPLQLIQVSADRTHFIKKPSGTKFRVWGVNYDHDDQGRLLEDYWHSEWPTVVEDFREIKALGANVVRIHLQLGKFMSSAEQANERELDRLKELLKLAESVGLYLDLTGLGCYHKQDVPAWYDTLDEAGRWQTQARFWQAIAKTCRDSPAVFCYDLMNEPILPGDKPEKEWLGGELAGKYFVQRVTLDLRGRTRTEVAKIWIEQLCSAIRQVDPDHLITVGVIPWSQVFPGAKPIFYAPEAHGPLDFVSIHFYPQSGKSIESALQAIQAYEIGKPLLIEETFPLSASIEETLALMDAANPRVTGWVSFYWGATIEENERKNSITGSIVSAWLRAFSQRSEAQK